MLCCELLTTPTLPIHSIALYSIEQVELAPPSPGDVAVAIGDMSTKIANAQKQTFRTWTVNQTVLNTVVGMEIACWFFIGECIGKGSLVGYQV